MLINLHSDVKETVGYRYMVLQMDVENCMDRMSEQGIRKKRTLIFRIRDKQLKFLGHIMRMKGLENLSLTEPIESNRRWWNGLAGFLEKREMLLRASKDRKL